jgi:cytochrome c oxidase subunit 2
VHKFWSILFGAVLGVCGLASLISPLVGWKLPDDVCSYGPSVDFLFHLILAITGIAFVGTEVVLVWAMWRFAGRPGQKSPYIHGHHRLEMIWTAVPAGILLFIAFAQVKAWADIKYQTRMPEPTHVFEVSARQFEWRFRYPAADQLERMLKDWPKGGVSKVADGWEKSTNGQFDDVHVVNEVHTWKDAKVRMFLKTRDVLHSFFLPNLRIKQDALPGKTIPMWYDAIEENGKWNEDTNKWESKGTKYDWELACAELCGWGHYKMRGRLYVHPSKENYLAWLKWAAAQQDSREREQ